MKSEGLLLVTKESKHSWEGNSEYGIVPPQQGSLSLLYRLSIFINL